MSAPNTLLLWIYSSGTSAFGGDRLRHAVLTLAETSGTVRENSCRDGLVYSLNKVHIRNDMCNRVPLSLEKRPGFPYLATCLP